MSSRTLLLLDVDHVENDLKESRVYKWNGYEETSDCLSIPAYLESNSDRLRAKYLKFINNLGETKICGNRIIDHLSLKNGYNLWWMSLVVEKSPFKSPGIFDCLRLLALEEIIQYEKPEKLILYSSSAALLDAVKVLCDNLGVTFSWHKVKAKKKIISNPLDIYRLLPNQIRSFLSLVRQILKLWKLKKRQNVSWFYGDTSLTIISYFDNLDVRSFNKGNFRSAYWGSLNEVIHSVGKNVNWLQIFSTSSVSPNVHSGLFAVEKYNEKPLENGYHAFLEGYLDFSCIAHSCFNYIRLVARRWHWNEDRISAAFQPKGSAAWLWPFLKYDCLSSIRGTNLVQNLLWIDLFDSAMADIPKQKMGLYLQENQDWERALIHAWRRHGHGQLIGVVHTPIRYWDLRYFNNICEVETASMTTAPPPHICPDFIALNGPFSFKSYIDDGYALDKLVSVEALRYENILELVPRERVLETRDINDNIKTKVLVLGQILRFQTHATLACLEQVVTSINEPYGFTLKNHPNCPIAINNYPVLNLSQTNEALEKILLQFDMVIVAGSSTAALDAYMAGLRVIVYLDACDFNYSPVRGFSGVTFVTTPKEMKDAIELECKDVETEKALDQFFWLDRDLPRWRRFLEN